MTGTHIAPYLNFQGRAREAFERYHEIFGGELSLMTFDESGQIRPATGDEPIAHGRLVAGEIRIYGSDGNPRYPATPGDTIALTLTGTDRELLTKAFEALAQGGHVKMRLTDAPWGSAGWLTDAFGINWNVDIAPGD